MFGIRWVWAAARGTVGMLTMLPPLALVVAILVHRGTEGGFRLSLFPIALLTFDPFAWTCARNSLIFSSAVTAIALIGGVGVGWALATAPHRGRSLFKAALYSMLAASPACLALGLLGVWGWPNPWVRSTSMQLAASGRQSLETWSGWATWLLWIWSIAPGAVALVAIATARAHERIETAWCDAARLAGAGQFLVWRSVSWPLIRPAAARAAAIVFSLALLEPGAPLILGLRRTLAFQIVEAASRPDPFPRIAVWTAMAAVISLAGRWLLRSWGGSPLLVLGAAEPANDGTGGRRTAPRAGMAVAIASMLILPSSVIVGWLPVLGLARFFAGPGIDRPGATGPPSSSLVEILDRAVDPPVPGIVANSLLLGFEVGLGVWILSLLQRPAAGTRLAATSGSRFIGQLALMSPMVQAVGILAMMDLGQQVMRLADGLPGSRGHTVQIAELASELEAQRNPWPILTVAVGLSVGLRLLQSWRRADERRPGERPSGLDAALLAGSSSCRARSVAALRPARWIGAVTLAAALAGVNLVPALLFARWMDVRTAAPAMLVLAEGDRASRLQAATLATFVIAGNLAGLAAARLAPAPPPEWDEDPP